MKEELLRVAVMAMVIAYWITWFVGSISFIAMEPDCYRAAARGTLLDCIHSMPFWFGWAWQAGYGWFGG